MQSITLFQQLDKALSVTGEVGSAIVVVVVCVALGAVLTLINND